MSRTSVAVIVASVGRPQALADLLEDLNRQSRPADKIILSLNTPVDLPSEQSKYSNVEVLFGPKGSCVQRNAAIDHLGNKHDIIFFMDDDYVPSRYAIERSERLILSYPNIAGATGHLLADGINGPGVGIAEAREMLFQYDSGGCPPLIPYRDLAGLYGCNMVFRASCIDRVRFDERLPLYGWQEDIDFSAQVANRGRIVKSFAFAGVHRGIKSGRSSGVRVGYSQMVNPIYLARKGTMRPRYAARIMMHNFVANHARAFRADPWIDRMGRARGNWLGLIDIVLGRINPERIVRL